MGQGGCVDGHLVTTSYASPIPYIGLYIAAASLVCFFLMSFDLTYGFIRKKPFLPCKLFPLNSITLTIVAVATKIPVDLTTSMPRAEDQVSKLTGAALMCTVIGFYMPSLVCMSTSERYSNLAALTMVAITMVVNVCIQMKTGVIFAFTAEHIIIMICTLILILLMWSSSVAFTGHREFLRNRFLFKLDRSQHLQKGLKRLRRLIGKLHVINYICNPQTLLCENPHHQTLGFLCAASSAVVSQAVVRTFATKSVRLCSNSSGVSDYEWSISVVIMTQLLTIAVGTLSIIYRWFAVAAHINYSGIQKYLSYGPQSELEYLKFKVLPFSMRSRNIFKVLSVAKDFIMDVLIYTQVVLHVCSIYLIGFPFIFIFRSLRSLIHIFHKRTKKDIEEKSNTELERAIGRRRFKSLLKPDFLPLPFLIEKASKNVTRWANTYQGDCPTHLVSFISKFPPAFASISECDELIRELERIGAKKNRRYSYEHRVSCVSVVVLSAVLAKMMPSSRRESVMHILDESLEIIYYVEQKTTIAPSSSDKTRWTSVKYLWGRWEDPKDWFQTKIISYAFRGRSLEKSEESQLKLNNVLGSLREALHSVTRRLNECANFFIFTQPNEYLYLVELATICEFILHQKHESVKHLLDFLEMFFVKLLCFSLSGLLQAIVEEIYEEYPSEIGEERVRKALKFLCKLDQLSQVTKIEWSRGVEFDPKPQPASDISQMVPSCSSAPRVEVSDLAQGELVGNSDVSLPVIHDAATAATLALANEDDDDDNDDKIVEPGSLENV